MILTALVLAQASAPAAEATALGTRLARTGSIMALLPIIARKDTEELVAAHPELSATERQTLRDTAQRTFRDGVARIETAFGAACAKRFTVAELRVLVAQAESPEQQRLRAAQPQVMAEAMTAIGSIDLKKDIATTFCKDAGKLCPK